jgi:hypothetical protein
LLYPPVNIIPSLATARSSAMEGYNATSYQGSN